MPDLNAPLANVFTLGARNLPALRAFYLRLGWPQVVDDDDFAAFELHGAVLALFPLEKLAADGRGRPSPAAAVSASWSASWSMARTKSTR